MGNQLASRMHIIGSSPLFSTIEFIIAIEEDLAALALSTLLCVVLTRDFHNSVTLQVIRFWLRNRSMAIGVCYRSGLLLLIF